MVLVFNVPFSKITLPVMSCFVKVKVCSELDR
jgi:hypothetical protein